ncbi:MAG: hypothetical protein ACPGXK_16275 [Phycisphaerae bacterium]
MNTLTITILATVALSSTSAMGENTTNVSETNKWSWSENAGWMNWRDANNGEDGVVVKNTHLEGKIWAENFGWINLGNGNAPYSNTDNTNFGVNVDEENDRLFGMAWSENAGWINFGTGSTDNPARVDFETGRLHGMIWSESLGWINLDGSDHFVSFNTVQSPVVSAIGPRYIQVSPAAGSAPIALVLTSTDAECLNKFIDLDGDSDLAEMGVAMLVDEPVYRSPAEWGTLLVRGEEVVPGYTYSVQPYLQGTGLAATAVSDKTYAHGDVDNNGFANFADIQPVVQAFQGTYEGSLGSVDLAPCTPNGIVNFSDIQQAVLAFQLQPYEATCSLPCNN